MLCLDAPPKRSKRLAIDTGFDGAGAASATSTAIAEEVVGHAGTSGDAARSLCVRIASASLKNTK